MTDMEQEEYFERYGARWIINGITVEDHYQMVKARLMDELRIYSDELLHLGFLVTQKEKQES